MKKFAICTVLALSVILYCGVATPAQAICIHFTNYCDSISLAGDPNEAGHLYGNWDWECGLGATSIYGANGKQINVGTRPVDLASGYAFPYSAGFVFTKSTKLFDLIGTNGSTTLLFVLGSPWTTSGSCSFAGSRDSGKRSTLGR